MRVPYKYLKSRVCNLGTAGLLVAIFGLVMAFYGFPTIIRSQLSKRLALKNGTENYEIWKELPFPMTFKVYIFNVTNPEEIVSGAKPIVQEIGPYVYDQYRHRINIQAEDNDSLSYDLLKIHKFNEKLSAPLQENDEIVVLHAALMGMAITINSILPSMMKRFNSIIEPLFNTTDPFLRTTVSELLFDGVFIDCSSSDMTVALICQAMKAKSPPTMRRSDNDDGFYYAMFKHYNNTPDGPYVVHSGGVNIGSLAETISYKNNKRIDQWEDECGEIRGTDAALFSPVPEANISKHVFIFQPDFCRSLYADYVSKRVTLGVTTYRYEVSKALLGGIKTNPKNKCFCPRNWSKLYDGCNIDGLYNLESCQKAPVILSFPHFYLADPILLNYVEGLSPDKKKHGTFVDLEPRTGAPVMGYKRIQFNMEVMKISTVPMLSEIEPGIFPILWLEEGATIGPSVQNLLKRIDDAIKYMKVLQWIIVAIGIILMMAACSVRRKGFTDKWSWSPNRVDNELPSYGDSVPGNEVVRPAAAQKEGRFHCFQNKAFNSNETIAHK